MEGENITQKHKKKVDVSQCGIKYHINIIKEFVVPKAVVNNDILLDEDTTTDINGCMKGKVLGKPILSCSFRGTSYFGLCDLGSPATIIPYSLYAKIIMTCLPRF